MDTVKINHKSKNLELVSKLMNSVATKYDCSVKYHDESGTIQFTGDESYKPYIAQETMGIFSRKR